MRALRKINNNSVICVDSANREMIAMGKGLGFGTLPRDIELSEVERTFYNVSPRYHDVLRDLPEDVVDFSARIIDIAANELPYTLSPNAVFTLADHVAFAIERARKQIHVRMPLAYDVEQMYPAEYKLGQYTVKRIRKEFRIGLPDSEATGIAMNLLNSRADGEGIADSSADADTDAEMLEEITEIVENTFARMIDRESFNYSRYATHLQYLFVRIHQHEDIRTDNLQMYASLREEFPEVADCVEKIAAHIKQKWGCELSEEEKLYLILHVNRICVKE